MRVVYVDWRRIAIMIHICMDVEQPCTNEGASRADSPRGKGCIEREVEKEMEPLSIKY